MQSKWGAKKKENCGKNTIKWQQIVLQYAQFQNVAPMCECTLSVSNDDLQISNISSLHIDSMLYFPIVYRPSFHLLHA